MTEDEILAEFRAAEALLTGHFLLSSGRHSGHYLQCARVLMDAGRAGRLAFALTQKFARELRASVDLVVSPAMGGVIIGHEVGRALERPAIFVERPSGAFELRRGFAIPPGARVLLVEDVVTTGLSSREAIAAVEREGGTVIAACALVDRSSGSANLGVPFEARSISRPTRPTIFRASLPRRPPSSQAAARSPHEQPPAPRR